MSSPEVLWSPTPERIERSRLAALARRAGQPVGDYVALWEWSVTDLEGFWGSVWEEFGVVASAPFERVLAHRAMPGAQWFPGARLNLAENVLRHDAPTPALVAVGEEGEPRETSWPELRAQVAALARTLRDDLGVRPGDRVAAQLPHVPETVVAFLACAAVGATWSVCSPDIGPGSARDRFAQLEPVVLLAADGQRFGGQQRDRREAIAELRAGLPTVRHTIGLDVLGHGLPDALPWAEAVATPAEPAYAQVEGDHPLWVVFSSGTTGLPKGLVHGHAGVLLMGHAGVGLQHDVQPGDRFCWYTTTSWIMWNVHLSVLLQGATAVLYDGSPLHPSADRLWDVAERTRLTHLGVSPAYLAASAKAGLHPARDHDLSALRAVGATGSPMPAASFRWVRDELGEVEQHVISGGTDFAAAVIGWSPWSPVVAGEMSGRALGCAVDSWDDDGRPLRDEVGELVITEPLPSMPLRIWGDDSGERLRDTYFDTYPGVWRHGDWLTLTGHGTAVISGRSDSTLNRHGVRMGSSDVYAAVEALDEVAEALVLGIEQPDGGYWLPLFVRLAPGAVLDDALRDRLRTAVRDHASPRHVPDEVVEVPAIPHTVTGKKLEVPLKRLFQGVPLEKAVTLGAVDDPEAVRWFVRYAEQRG